jgi:hypothetical protein
LGRPCQLHIDNAKGQLRMKRLMTIGKHESTMSYGAKLHKSIAVIARLR